MKKTEKNLVLIATLLFAVVLVVRIFPLALDYYRQGQDDIALMQERMERYRTLIVETEQWQDKEKLKLAEIADLQSWTFNSADPNLVSSSLQRNLRQIADSSGVELREMGVPRYSYVSEWLMVEQDANFSLSQDEMLPFLNNLQQTRPRLPIAAFSLTRNRRQFTGTVTVVGFAKMMEVASAQLSKPATQTNQAPSDEGPEFAPAGTIQMVPAGEPQ
jgi:hypothetical protein